MKTTIAASIILIVATLCARAESQFVTVKGTEVTFEASDILQIVGAVTTTKASSNSSFSGTQNATLKITLSGGTVVENLIGLADQEASAGAHAVSNPLLGTTLVGVTSMQVTNGTGAVTVKIMKQASQFVSEPVMLPLVDDGTYSISLETSVDLTNWAPAAPGDYLGSTSHRFFRVKAVKKLTEE